MKILNKIFYILLILLILTIFPLFFSGCGTMMGQTPHRFIINTTPEHVNVALNSPHLIIGKTPLSLNLIHHWHFQWTNTHQTLIFSKKGYKTVELLIYIVNNNFADLTDIPLDFITLGISGWTDQETGADYKIWNQAKLCNVINDDIPVQCRKIIINPDGVNIGMLPLIKKHKHSIKNILQTLSTAKYTSYPYFKKFALRAYQTDSPLTIYHYKKFNYTALPITKTLSDCKIISVVRWNKNSYQKKIVNFKICSCVVKETKITNANALKKPLPKKIKPIIKKVIEETNKYGKAKEVYGVYTVVGKKQGYNKKFLFVYVLKGIRLISLLR